MILPYPGAKGAAVCRFETVGSGRFFAERKTVPVEALPLAFCPHAPASLPEARQVLSIAQVQTKK
jgi:hypothetical protein